MWQIDKNFDDYTRPNKKGKVVLSADQPLHPSAINYPLIWSGMLNGKEIRIKQIDVNSKLLEHFKFEKFPEGYEHIKTDIIKWIDDKLKTMD